MEGYGQSVDLYKKALDSAGTSEKKFQLYQEGTQAKLDKLKASFEQVWMTMFDSKAIQTVITSFTALTKSASSIVDHFGALAPVLGIAGTAILAFNGGLKSIMINGALTLSTLKSLSTQGLRSIDGAFTAATLKARLFAAASSGVSLTLKGLKTALISTGTFLAGAIFPMAAFAAIGFAIQKVTEAISKQREEAKKLKAEQDNIVRTYSAHSSKVEELASKYGKLNKQVENGQLDSSSKEYTDTMNQLGKLMPSLVKSTDEHGNSIIRSRDAVKEELAYAKKLKENYDQMTVAKFEEDLDKQASKVDDILKKVEEYKKNMSGQDAPILLQTKGIVNVDKGQKLEDQRGIIEQEKELQLLLHQSVGYIKDKSKAFMDMDGVTDKLSTKNKKLVDSFIEEAVASKKSVKDGEDLRKFLRDTIIDAEDFAKKLAGIPSKLEGVFSAKDVSGMTKNQLAVLSSIQDSVKSGYTDWDQYKEVLKKVGFNADEVAKILKLLKGGTDDASNATKSATISAEDLAQRLSDAKGNFDALSGIVNDLARAGQNNEAITVAQTDAYQALADKISPLNTLLEDLANGKAISASEAMNLVAKEKDLAKAITVENGIVKINKDAVLKLRDAKVASFKDMINAQKTEVENQAKALTAKLKNYGVEIKAIMSVVQANEALALATKKRNDAMDAINNSNSPGAMHASQVIDTQYVSITSEINKIKDAYSALDSLSSVAATGLKQVGTAADTSSNSTKKNTKAQKDNNKETQQSTYVTDKFKQKMEELNLAIEKQKNIQSKYPTWSKQYQNSIKEEIKLLEQKKKAIDNEAKSLDKQIKSGKVIKKGEVVSESRTSGGDKPSTIKSNRKLSGWSGTVTQEKTNGHRGYDIDGKIGDRLDANVNGKVTFAGRGKGSAASYGNVIYVVDSSGKQHRYAHLNKVSVSVGDIVKIGQKIGEIGNTGNTSKGRSGDGSHLHYEVLDKNGKLLNPSSYVNASRGKKITTVTPTSSKPVSNSARIWDFLKSKGFSDSAAAGVLGNIQQESSFNTGAVNPKTGAYGIGQWLGSRLTNLKKYAKSKGKSYKDLNVQMEYLYKELSGADSTTKSKLKKYGGLSGLKKMNVSDAVKAFENAFERSGGDSMSKRQKYAKSNYDKYKGTSSKDRANQAKDVDDATSTLNDLKGQSLQTTQEIQDLYKQLIDAVVSGFEKQQSDLDIDLEKSQLRMSRLVEGSAGYTKELDKQKKILQDKQKVNKDEIDYLKKQNDLRVLSSSTIKKNEAEIKSLEKKNKAYKLNAKEREQNEKKINSLEKSNDKKEKRVTTLKKENKDKHTSAKERKANQKEIDKLNKEIKKNNSTIDKLENANKLKKLSSSEIKKNQVRIDALKKANNSRVLSVATRAENDKIIKELQKGNEDLINQLQELEFQKVQSIIKAFDDAVDKINDKISLSKAKMDSYKEGSSGYFSELKKQIGYTVDEVEQYKKKVAGLQKQLKNKSLTPAQLEELKKQLAEANIQLQETKNSLQDLQQSYKDIISDTLTKQKEANIQHLQDGFDKLNKQLDELIKKDESFDFGNFADSIDDVINSLDELDGHFTSNAFFETSTWDVRSLISDTKKKITDLDTSVKKLANSTSASQSGLEGIIRSESELANQIYDQIKDIDNQIRDTQLLYKQQEDALQNQIDLKQEQLDQLDEQYQKEDRIKAFQDLMDERNKVMADKRFITIDASGKETLTYDKAKADDLNKQIDEMNTNNAREDAKKALQDQINIMQKDLDKTKQIHQASLQAMQLYRDGLQGEYDALITDIGNKKDELKELQDKQIEDTTKQWDDLIKAVTDGTMTYDQLMKTWYASTIADMKQYNADVASELATLKQSLSDLLATQEAIKNAKSSSSSSSSSNSSSGSSKTNTTTTSKTIKSYDVIVYDPKTKKNTTTNTKTLADANKIVAKYKANVVDVVPKYHEGGIVGDIPTGNSKIANLVNKLFNVKSNEQLSLLKKGEVVINPSLPNVQRNFNNILNAMIPNVPTVVQSGDTIHLNIEKVVTNDASTFLPDLQRIISTRKS